MKPYPTLQLFYLSKSLPKLKKKYLDITGKIKEIVAIGVLPIDLLGERLNCVLVGNVFDHESGSPISADTAHIYHEIIGIIIPSFIVVNHVVLLIHLRKVAWILVVGRGHWLVFFYRRVAPDPTSPCLFTLFSPIILHLGTDFLNIFPRTTDSSQLDGL